MAIRYLAAKGSRVLLVTSHDAPGLRDNGWHIIADPFDEDAEAKRTADIEAVRQEDERRGRWPRHWWEW
jgi:hypothetical protein